VLARLRRKLRIWIVRLLPLAGIVLLLMNVSGEAAFQPMRHPQTGEDGVWGSKQDFLDATIAYEVQKARADTWEATARQMSKDAKVARAEAQETAKQIARIPGLVEQERKDAYKKGRSQGRQDAGILAVIGAIIWIL